MKLKELKIELRPCYADDAGKYVGKLVWEDKQDTEIKIPLPPDFSEKLLLFVAPILEEYAKQSATMFAQSVQQSVVEARNVTLITQ